MKYSLSLGGDLLSPAREAFDKMLLKTLQDMRRRGLDEGSVTLKLIIDLEKQFPYDDGGREREVYVPSFEHEVKSETKQTDKATGKLAEDLELREVGGLPAIYSRDDQTFFDMVEEREAAGVAAL